MVGTFRIGKVLGFEINIHWSWLFIFLLITWTFATSTLEEFYPEWTTARRWIVGSAASIIFFLSITRQVGPTFLSRCRGWGRAKSHVLGNIKGSVGGGPLQSIMVFRVRFEPAKQRTVTTVASAGHIEVGTLSAVTGIGPEDNGADDINICSDPKHSAVRRNIRNFDRTCQDCLDRLNFWQV